MFVRYGYMLALICILTACKNQENEQAEVPSTKALVSIESDAITPKDEYMTLDLRALVGVDPAASRKALAGDPVTALTIGSQFDRFGKTTEARYWYQIAADNGSGVGMQRLSMMMAESNCYRAIYWLKKALDTDELIDRTRDDNEKDLERYREACKEPLS